MTSNKACSPSAKEGPSLDRARVLSIGRVPKADAASPRARLRVTPNIEHQGPWEVPSGTLPPASCLAVSVPRPPTCPGQRAALMSGHSARLKSPQRSVVPNANPSIWVRSGRPERGFLGADSAHRLRHISLASPLRATGGIRIVVGHCDRFLMEGGAHAQSAPTNKKEASSLSRPLGTHAREPNSQRGPGDVDGRRHDAEPASFFFFFSLSF